MREKRGCGSIGETRRSRLLPHNAHDNAYGPRSNVVFASSHGTLFNDEVFNLRINLFARCAVVDQTTFDRTLVASVRSSKRGGGQLFEGELR